MQNEHQDLPYRDVFLATPASLLVLSPDFVIREANTAYLQAVGRRREELIGRHFFDVFPQGPGDDESGRANLRASLERARDTGRPDTMAIQRYDLPVGEGQHEERYWSPIQVPVVDQDGRTVLLLHRAEDVTALIRELQQDTGLSRDEVRRQISEVQVDVFARTRELQALNAELRATHEQLLARALRDPMTDLLIRPVVLEQITRALSRTARRAHTVAVLFIDLDGLKHVNDTLGHAAGDELIRCFAQHLRRSVRPSDPVARFGGDEFLVLLEDLDHPHDAEGVAARVLEGLDTCPLTPELRAHPSASIGVAIADREKNAEALVARADQAMYRAKQAGGNRYELAPR